MEGGGCIEGQGQCTLGGKRSGGGVCVCRERAEEVGVTVESWFSASAVRLHAFAPAHLAAAVQVGRVSWGQV